VLRRLLLLLLLLLLLPLLPPLVKAGELTVPPSPSGSLQSLASSTTPARWESLDAWAYCSSYALH
jgi:hypothetical protein